MHSPVSPGNRALAAFSVAAARRFDNDRCMQVAGGLTFTTLLSLVPLLAVALSVSSTLPVFDQWMEALQHFVVRNFLPDTGRRIIRTQLTEFAANAGQLTAIGLAFLGVTAISLMLGIDETFHRLFRAEHRRSLPRRLLLYILLLGFAPLLIGASISMTSWLVGQSLGLLGEHGWASVAVLRGVPYVFTCIAFTLLYLVLPNCKVAVRHALAGGLFAGLVFEFAKVVFAVYVTNFATYTMIYGAFAAIPIFLLWIYLSWLVVLLGATITALLPDYEGAFMAPSPGTPVVNPAPVDCGTIPPAAAQDATLSAIPANPGPAILQEAAPMSALPVPSPSIDRRERLIAALDVPAAREARALVESLGDSVRFYKIGLELFTAGGNSGGYFELLDWLVARDKKVFADLKFYDIPETVRRAVANLKGRGVTFVTVHGHRSVMQAAVAAQSGVKILAVTVLTSFDKSDLEEMGIAGGVQQLVLSRARGAIDCGCDGVIASGLEAPQLKAAFGSRLLLVTPGIRPAEGKHDGKPADDQKRTVDVAQAFANGADYIVVGRPIRDAADPRAAAEAIQATIAGVFPA